MLQSILLQTTEFSLTTGTTAIVFVVSFLLILGGFIYLNGRIAKWKGYPFWAGAISGFFLLGGTILFLLMPFNQKKDGE